MTKHNPAKPQHPAVTMADLDVAAEDYNAALVELNRSLTEMEEELRPIRAKYLPRIRAALKSSNESESRLDALLRRGKSLFQKPKSRLLHQIKMGWRKDKDTLTAPPDDKLIPVIESVLPEVAHALIKTTKEVRKDVLKGLTKEQLKDIGVSYVIGGDASFITPTDSEESQLAAALRTAKGLISSESEG